MLGFFLENATVVDHSFVSVGLIEVKPGRFVNQQQQGPSGSDA
jgi:hypothetical protein